MDDVTDTPNVDGSHIVGGQFFQARGYYDGRGQTLLYTARSQEEVVRKVSEEIREVIAAFGTEANRRFPNNDMWEVRVW